MNCFGSVVKKQMFGFAITGLISTLIMFTIYVMLYKLINYQYAYVISYSISVIALYFMNMLVFKKTISLKTALEFPMIYLLQYLLSAVSLAGLVRLGIPLIIAPLCVVIILLPLTFFLNRLVF
ncbi:MAG: GtrA family protein [bacterium]|nr:GtrA family protein [bacterium]